MTAKQQAQFNTMLATLKMISKGYESPDKLRKTSEKTYGLEYSEVLEMAYENIQADAARAIKGIKEATT